MPRYDAPPVIAIEIYADIYAPFQRQRRRMAAMLTELDAADWNADTRCDAWTVHDVVAHLAGVNTFWWHSITAGLEGNPTRHLATFDPAATPDLMISPMRDMSSHALLDGFIASNEALIDVLTDMDEISWETLAEAPPGHLPIRIVAHHALWDAWIHERDILLPLGIIPPEEADEVLASLRYVAALNPALAIGTGTATPGVLAIESDSPKASLLLTIAESVTVADVEIPSTVPRLVGNAPQLVDALSIRGPLPTSTPDEWLQLRDGLASAFDTP